MTLRGEYFCQPPQDTPPPLSRPRSSLTPRELFPERVKINPNGISSEWCGRHTRFKEDDWDSNIKGIQEEEAIHYMPICAGFGTWEKGKPDGRRDVYMMYESDYFKGKSETITLSRGVGRTRGWGENTIPSKGQVIIGSVPTQEKSFMGEGTRRGISVIGRVEEIFNYQEEKDKFEEKEKIRKEIIERSDVDIEFSKGHWDNVDGRCQWMDNQLGTGAREVGIVVRPFACVPFKEPIILGKGPIPEDKWVPRTPCNVVGRNTDVVRLYKKMIEKSTL